MMTMIQQYLYNGVIMFVVSHDFVAYLMNGFDPGYKNCTCCKR